MKHRLLLIASVLASLFGASSGALSQSACPYIAYGAVLTAAQWNACFSAKNDVLGYVPVNKAGDVMLGKLTMFTSSPTGAGINLPQGSAPTNPNNGDVWTTIAGMFVRINGFTVGPLAATTTASFAATSPITVAFAPGTVTYGFNYGVAGTFLAQQTDQGATTTSPGWYAQVAGDTFPRVRVGLNATDVASVAFGPGNAARDVFIERVGPGALRYGAPDAASAIAQSFSLQNVAAGTSNTAGATATFKGSQGTGSGAGGGWVFQTAPAGSSGTAQNALVNALVINPSGGITVGAAPTGGDQDAGAINVAGGYYVNGALISPASGGASGQILQGVTSSSPVWTAAPTLGASGTLGTLAFGNATSGTVTLQPAAGALGSAVLTMPAATDTLAVLAASQAFTNKTYNGLTVTTTTGTLTIAAAKTLTDTSGVGASILLGATGGGFSGYGGASACAANNFITALSAAGASTCGGSTISGVALGSNLFTLTFGTHLAAGDSSYNGSAGVTITSDATNVNTASTIVARDSSGNFSAGTITAAVVNATTGFEISGAATTGNYLRGNGTNFVGSAILAADLPLSSASAFGAVKPDNSTITISAGVISTVGGVATTVTPGTTTVTGGTPGDCLGTGSSGSLMNQIACASLAATGQVLSGGANVTANSIGTVTSGTTTIDCGKSPLQYLTNGGAFTLAAPSNDGSCIIQVTNNGSAGAITFSGFTVGSNTGAALTTTNTSKFMISIARVNGSSIYNVTAQQ